MINLGRQFADLDSGKFHFDLDADGEQDWVPSLAAGSAFVALDRNHNQRIDNGNELFGPRSGDGFSELAMHDDNRDGKIDAEDSVYARLKIWRPGGELLALADVGVHSISLQAVTREQDYRGIRASFLVSCEKRAILPVKMAHRGLFSTSIW
ncbi:hypothetical protein [Dongshaea marina]|uniref:hypothetical protein n=1 Tax=Dongshaea marina TaxID=2047966 RepID=UPI000D3EBBCB|nr:hypothetical protein [Dongshaea marina]